jgi:hypothetical protein
MEDGGGKRTAHQTDMKGNSTALQLLPSQGVLRRATTTLFHPLPHTLADVALLKNYPKIQIFYFLASK